MIFQKPVELPKKPMKANSMHYSYQKKNLKTLNNNKIFIKFFNTFLNFVILHLKLPHFYKPSMYGKIQK